MYNTNYSLLPWFPLSLVSFILWYASCGLLTVLWAFAIGLLGTYKSTTSLCYSPCCFFCPCFMSVCLIVSVSLSHSLSATVIHASFRTPNLKARLNTFREEFRAVWRNYSELQLSMEFTAGESLSFSSSYLVWLFNFCNM